MRTIVLLAVLTACSAETPNHPYRPTATPSRSAGSHPDPRQGHVESQRDATYLIRAARMIDGISGKLHRDISLLVRGNRIEALGPIPSLPKDAVVIDLGDRTLLPGFMDVHTHIMLEHGAADDYAGYDAELYQRSTAYRALVASRSARWALSHGFTAIRDVCTEGAMYADADLKRAINKGLVAGPRMWVSTRGVTSTGNYVPSQQSWELGLPMGAEVCDGVEVCLRAVRQQVARGADWIKLFADWDTNNFSPQELLAIVEETHRQGRKVAAHANTPAGIKAALDAGVDSIEHGRGVDAGLAARMAKDRVVLVPTLSVYERTGGHERLAKHQKTVARAYRAGVRIAVGTDIGVYPWTQTPAREFVLMVKAGMSPMDAIRSGTSIPAEMLGVADTLGHIAEGKLADLVAVPGNPLDDIQRLETPDFVMKDGYLHRAPDTTWRALR